MEQKVVLEMRGINKNFPGVKMLQDVDLTLGKGEIHALMGESGAGKSTLIKVPTSVKEFETGTIRMEGSYNTIIDRSPQEVQESSTSTAYQGMNLCPNLSVAEDLYIGRESKKGPMIDWRTMKEDAGRLLGGLDVHVDVTMAVENYSIAIQQMIVVTRAINMSAKALILDKPASSLDDGEMGKLFVLMRQLRAKGIGIVFMTHLPEQVYAVCDGITVPRNGTPVNEFKMEELLRMQLVAETMGRDFNDLAVIKKKGMSVAKRDAIISARELGCRGTIKPFSLDIHKGEVIDLTGFLGFDRFELVRAIHGTDKPGSSELAVKGEELKINAPIDAVVEDMACLPENRKEEGIIADLSVWENIIIVLQAKRDMFKFMNGKKQEEFTSKYVDILQIKTADREIPIKQFFGGNQQKVILGRWLLTSPDFLTLDEPTGGIDIDTKTEIQKLVLRLVEEDMAVVFISSEIEEILRTCSRMTVMRDDGKVGELKEDKLSQDSIVRAIAEGRGEWWRNLKS